MEARGGAWRRVEVRCRNSNLPRVDRVRALAVPMRCVLDKYSLLDLKMELYCPSGLPAVSRKKNLPESNIIYKSFIDQACTVKMARSSFQIYGP